MSPIEITLIILGIIIIIFSCFLIDRNSQNGKQAVSLPFSFDKNVTEEDKKKLLDRIQELLDDVSEETINHTEDSLSKISNEKIMAVNEFSDQILEKIKRNHEEVVFLYNMLNDKEKELKYSVKEIDATKKKVQDILEISSDSNNRHNEKNSKEQTMETKSLQAVKLVENVSKASDITSTDREDTNYNSRILALYSQGKSIVEISKLLGLGQGEVKLVIDLYKGKK